MTNHDTSGEQLANAAADTLRQGDDVRARVRDLTLRALTGRRFDAGQVREVVRAVTEGIGIGAAQRGGQTREVLSQAFAGLDEALMKWAEATRLALQELASRTRELNDTEVKRVLTELRRLEGDFLSTLHGAAQGAEHTVRTELQDLVRHARHAGTDTGALVAATLRDFSRDMGSIVVDTARVGLDQARELSVRFMEVAGGILAGMADALRQQRKPTKEP